MATLPFVKMQGLGNDFIVIDDVSGGWAKIVTPEFARKICDRRFGVGADQILWLRQAHESGLDVRMEILNSDGSVAEMCGNGIRAVALYLQDHGARRASTYQIETLAGVKSVKLAGRLVTVDMGAPLLGAQGEEIAVVSTEGESAKFQFFEVGMGNPHAVIFVPGDVDAFPVEKWGPMIEKHPRFPKRTNVEFVQVESRRAIRVRVWERGSGITLACGTGACGSAVAAVATGRTESSVEVKLPGGSLQISWEGAGKNTAASVAPVSVHVPVMMTGPAEEVFRGEYRV